MGKTDWPRSTLKIKSPISPQHTEDVMNTQITVVQSKVLMVYYRTNKKLGALVSLGGGKPKSLTLENKGGNDWQDQHSKVHKIDPAEIDRAPVKH